MGASPAASFRPPPSLLQPQDLTSEPEGFMNLST